jgi:hypothetical protein
MALRLLLILISILLIAAIGVSSSTDVFDRITSTSIGAGLLGLLAAIFIGKSSYDFTVFLGCGLFVGFFVAGGLCHAFASILFPLFLWVAYATVFVVVGKRSFLNASVSRSN